MDLSQLGIRWALIGGLAVSLRGKPRTTQDLDVTVAVLDDDEAMSRVRDLTSRGYRIQWPAEHPDRGRLQMVRFLAESPEIREVDIDVIFASSGIEEEVIAASETLEILPDLSVPVATSGHLLALKTLAGRAKDVTDFATLVQQATERDLQEAREALELISRRGYDQGKNLQEEFVKLLKRAPEEV